MTPQSTNLGRPKQVSKGPTTRKTRKARVVEKQASRQRISSFTTTTSSYVEELYSDVALDTEMDTYLEETDCYNASDKTWIIPPAAAAEGLSDCMFNILSSILKRFVKPTQPSVKRELLNTHNVSACNEEAEDGYRAYPTLCIQASGPSFEKPGPLDFSLSAGLPSGELGFTDMATFFSVKRDSELGTAKEYVNEMASYAG